MNNNKFGFECKHYGSDFCDPPGSHIDILGCPSGNEEFAIERAVFKEHRFAFFFWSKWTHKFRNKIFDNNYAPDLVTIDFHDDLHQPASNEREELESLNLDNLEEVAKFTWARLNINNDGHIKSAAYKNVINNIYVLCKQEDEDSSYSYNDYLGNKHQITRIRNFDSFQKVLETSDSKHIYLDIDLDYFVKVEGNLFNSELYTLMDELEIRKLIDPKSVFMQWIFQRMCGFTIATEPEYCGGIKNSAWIIQIIEDQLFTDIYKWKHLDNK